MKTYKIENFGVDMYQNDKFGGAIHAIIEALFNALKDKSWDRIISIGTDPTTFEGTVEYEDEDFQDNVYSYIHRSCYYVANLMRSYIHHEHFKDNQFFGFVTGCLYAMGNEYREPGRDSVVASIAYHINDYIIYIESLAHGIEPGKRYTREAIENKFLEMGFSFPEN